MIVVIAAVAFLTAMWLTRQFADPRSRFHVLDHPNERSLHASPTPRSGGIAIFVALVVAVLLSLWSVAWPVQALWLAGPVVLIAAVSYLDDLASLSVRNRLIAHLIAAAVPVVGGLSAAELTVPGLSWTWPSVVAMVFTVLFMVWMTNLYNFMDGMDGFAGGMAVFGFGTYALLGFMSGQTAFAVLGLFIAVSAAGFLVLNFPPAKIFMGDVGSSVLGYLAGGMALWAQHEGIFPLWVAVLIFSPFVVDATVTLICRTRRGETITQAHRSHYYQRLVTLGWGHRRTVLWEYGLMAASSASALIAMQLNPVGQWTVLGLWVMAYLIIMRFVDRLERYRVETV